MLLKCSLCPNMVERKSKLAVVTCFPCKTKRKRIAARKSAASLPEDIRRAYQRILRKKRLSTSTLAHSNVTLSV